MIWNAKNNYDNLYQALEHMKFTEADKSYVSQDPRFGRNYRFVREFVFRRQTPEIPGYYLDVFERK